jgi:RNA polymerase sigma-70 factor (ECF subfamily)
VSANAYELILAAAPHLARAPTEHEQMLVARYLADRFVSAQRTCPGIALTPEIFWPYVAARLPPGRRTLDALDEVHFHDLYVACACQAGDPQALALIDQRHLPAAFTGIEQMMRLDAARIEDLKQVLRHQLFVVEEGRTPKITAYWGREPLMSWLRTVVRRAAREVLRQDRLAAARSRRQ